jgi:hypothetical protein
VVERRFRDNVYDGLYTGYLVDGEMSGSGGVFVFNNERGYYAGDFRNNKRHGWGINFYANGDIYEGEWDEGFNTGQGTFLHADGGYIDSGEFYRSELNGEGKRYASGVYDAETGGFILGELLYEGYFANGELIYSTGDSGDSLNTLDMAETEGPSPTDSPQPPPLPNHVSDPVPGPGEMALRIPDINGLDSAEVVVYTKNTYGARIVEAVAFIDKSELPYPVIVKKNGRTGFIKFFMSVAGGDEELLADIDVSDW